MSNQSLESYRDFDNAMNALRLNTFLLLVLFSNGLAQETEPLIVHEVVGERIEKSERELYELFPEIANFYAASFFKTDSTGILLKIETSEKKDKVLSKTYPVSLFLITQVRQQIESHLTGQTVSKPEVVDVGLIARERKRGREVFPGYISSLFGGGVTLAFAYGRNNGSNPSKAEIYLVWGTGSAFFSALAVQMAGHFDDGLKSFGASFGGAMFGSALGVLALEGSLQIENPGLIMMVILFAKPFLTSYGAINGYYAAAKSKYSRPAVSFEKSGVKLGVPDINFEIAESIDERFTVHKLSLVNLEF